MADSVTWGKLLWDQQSLMMGHVQGNVAFTSNCASFANQLATIERNYATQLQSAAQGLVLPPDANLVQISLWKEMQQAVHDAAQARMALSTAIKEGSVDKLQTAVQRAGARKEQVSQQIALKHSEKTKKAAEYDKVKKGFEKLQTAAVKAKTDWEKLDRRDDVKKKKVEEARKMWASKEKIADDAFNDIKRETHDFNNFNTGFYHTDMPNAFNSLQESDEERSSQLVDSLSSMVSAYKSASAAMSGSFEALGGSFGNFNARQDSNAFANEKTTNEPFPADIELEKPRSSSQAPEPTSASTEPVSSGGGQKAPPPPPPPVQQQPQFLCQAKVVYAFAGTNEGELGVNEMDIIDVIENDGSGWVRCHKDGAEGFVPESYVEMLSF